MTITGNICCRRASSSERVSSDDRVSSVDLDDSHDSLVSSAPDCPTPDQLTSGMHIRDADTSSSSVESVFDDEPSTSRNFSAVANIDKEILVPDLDNIPGELLVSKDVSPSADIKQHVEEESKHGSGCQSNNNDDELPSTAQLPLSSSFELSTKLCDNCLASSPQSPVVNFKGFCPHLAESSPIHDLAKRRLCENQNAFTKDLEMTDSQASVTMPELPTTSGDASPADVKYPKATSTPIANLNHKAQCKVSTNVGASNLSDRDRLGIAAATGCMNKSSTNYNSEVDSSGVEAISPSYRTFRKFSLVEDSKVQTENETQTSQEENPSESNANQSQSGQDSVDSKNSNQSSIAECNLACDLSFGFGQAIHGFLEERLSVVIPTDPVRRNQLLKRYHNKYLTKIEKLTHDIAVPHFQDLNRTSSIYDDFFAHLLDDIQVRVNKRIWQCVDNGLNFDVHFILEAGLEVLSYAQEHFPQYYPTVE